MTNEKTTNKKVLIEGIYGIYWLIDEIPENELFKDGLKEFSNIELNPIIIEEVKYSKNLTSEEKKKLRVLLIELNDTFNELIKGITERRLNELKAARDAFQVFCDKNDIEILSDSPELRDHLFYYQQKPKTKIKGGNKKMTNKKILIENLNQVAWLVEEMPENELFKDGLKQISSIAWNVLVNESVEYSKNLTNEDKEALKPLLTSLSITLDALKHTVSFAKLDMLEQDLNAIHDFCQKNNIEIISHYEEEENWDEEDTDSEAEDES